MGSFMLWTGVVVWIAIGALALWMLAEIAWGAVCAASHVRWVIRIAHKSGSLGKLKWSKLPQSFLSYWWDYIGYRNDGSTTITRQGCGSVWRGVGDYTVNKEP